MKSMTSPDSSHPKQWNVLVAVLTLEDGVRSWWNGQSPFIEVAAPLRATRSLTTSAMETALRTLTRSSAEILPMLFPSLVERSFSPLQTSRREILGKRPGRPSWPGGRRVVLSCTVLTCNCAHREKDKMSTTDETDERALKRDSADKAEHLLEHLITAKGGKRREGQVEMARAVATALSEGRPELMQGGTGIGKALDVDTPIPTLEGWVRMGDLEAGVHHPFDENGVPCNITEGFDVLRRRTCYELSFLGGGTLVADGQHQWN